MLHDQCADGASLISCFASCLIQRCLVDGEKAKRLLSFFEFSFSVSGFFTSSLVRVQFGSGLYSHVEVLILEMLLETFINLCVFGL